MVVEHDGVMVIPWSRILHKELLFRFAMGMKTVEMPIVVARVCRANGIHLVCGCACAVPADGHGLLQRPYQIGELLRRLFLAVWRPSAPPVASWKNAVRHGVGMGVLDGSLRSVHHGLSSGWYSTADHVCRRCPEGQKSFNAP